MNRWPIERSWLILEDDGGREQRKTSALGSCRACTLLGAAGLGKTYELRYLAALDRERGLDVRIERLASLGQTADGLEARLKRFAKGAAESTVLYLDALDEVMVPVRTTGLIVERWIRDTLSRIRPTLRISCRSAVWPGSVDSAIHDVYGKSDRCTAVLQPMSDDDIRLVAASRGIDGDGLLAQIESAGALVLSRQPLTLEMLLRVFRAQGRLPDRRTDLFAAGVQVLASERSERRDHGTAIDIPLDELLEAAERLACTTLLSGRELVDMGDEPTDASLGVVELGSLPASGRRLDAACLAAIGRSGLCDGDGDRRFRFAHRQFAEYLAGRRIARLLPHQARATLASGLGWKAGVSGPLRETAAFAAMESADIASWIADHDPEVIGLSDVADDSLRRRATLNLIGKFRRHELTDTQVRRDGIELTGFQYAGADQDLAPVLRERGDGCEDLLEGVIELVESWSRSSMSDDLATLMLDTTAPMHPRKSAGYALANFGTAAAKRRLMPLISGAADDLDLDLKGLALRCNWPENVSVPDLLAAITPSRARNYHGAYAGFLYSLDHDGFNASGHRVQGLSWAHEFVRRGGDYEPTVRIAKSIAVAALDEIDEPGVADALASLLITTIAVHASSPFIPAREHGVDAEQRSRPIFEGRMAVRRKLIDAVAAIAPADSHVWWIGHETPGFLVLEDFPWLLSRAADVDLPMRQRQHYVELARMLPWVDSIDCVEAWLVVREVEPIALTLAVPLSMELDSEDTRKARKAHAEMKRWTTPRPKKKLRPTSQERVTGALAECEKNTAHFVRLCRDMTLEEDSTHYGSPRVLQQTPGWATARAEDRKRIVAVAKLFLTSEHDEADRARTQPLGQLLVGHIAATWLVMDEEPAWIDSLPISWWRKWAWYFLRELHPYMHDESRARKQELLEKLHRKAPEEVRTAVRDLALSKEADTKNLLTALLDVLGDIDDYSLDDALCTELQAGRLPDDRAGDVAQFVLARNSDRAMPACLSRLDDAALAISENVAVRAAVALLHERTTESWVPVFDLLRRRSDLAMRILGEYAHRERFRARHDDDRPGLQQMGAKHVGQLFGILLEHFTPESDPDHGGEAHTVGFDDAARHLRDQLINWLGEQRDRPALEALRELESRFGEKYSWLRRPRSRVERAYRMAYWVPIDPKSIAEILAARDKRLIRSNQDALDGVVAAIEEYSRRLHSASPSEVDDLWNRPRGIPATPKEEERVSDKICVAVRNYFRDFAVVADREVQISRRTVGASAGGSPGSEVDVLYRVPAVGAANGDAIVIPIEVKLSHNSEARTGLRDQLVDRYMSELGTEVGVYVVAWVGTDKKAAYRSLWPSIDSAKAQLPSLVQAAVGSRPTTDVRAVVVDATLSRIANFDQMESKAAAGAKNRVARKKTARGKRKSTKKPALKTSQKRRKKPRR